MKIDLLDVMFNLDKWARLYQKRMRRQG